MMTVRIGSRLVGEGQPCFVVAEIGINHNGSLEIAQQLIDRAAEAGCNAVKFQKRTVHVVFSREELERPREVDISIIKNALARSEEEGVLYKVFPEESLERLRLNQAGGNHLNTTNGDLKYALEFHEKDLDLIDAHCRRSRILWFASCWDGLSLNPIHGLNVPCHKIASACLTHADLLRRARSKGKPVILSTGGSTLDQIERAVEILGKRDLIILHCTSNYPCPDEEVNLKVIDTLMRNFPGVPIGYSGHEVDLQPSLLAADMGACLVERHITLDREMPGSDHKASLEPADFEELVRKIRLLEGSPAKRAQVRQEIWSGDRVETILGDGNKRVYPAENEIMRKLRRRRDF